MVTEIDQDLSPLLAELFHIPGFWYDLMKPEPKPNTSKNPHGYDFSFLGGRMVHF